MNGWLPIFTPDGVTTKLVQNQHPTFFTEISINFKLINSCSGKRPKAERTKTPFIGLINKKSAYSEANANFVAVYERLSPDEVTSKINIVMSPADASNYHTQSGQRYLEDDYAYVYCEENTNFIFKGWYVGNKLVSTDRYFYYLVGGNDVTLTAKFEYNPTIPGVIYRTEIYI